MVGILLASHGSLADALKATSEMIAGPTEYLWAFHIDAGDHPEQMTQAFIEKVNQLKSGCLILVDMLGGSPLNATAPLLIRSDVAVVTGVNLPMLLTLITRRSEDTTLAQLVEWALESGKQGLTDVKSSLLSKSTVAHQGEAGGL